MMCSEHPVDTYVSRNRILAALPPHELAHLWPLLKRVDLVSRQVLQVPQRPVEYIYFPESGYVSRVVPMEDGAHAEVGLIGPEGIVGVAAVLGQARDGFEMLVQVPGKALRLSVQVFHEERHRLPVLQDFLNRYLLAHFSEVARLGACNSRHPVSQRLARWLLTAHDRVQSERFAVTHDALGMILGVRRAGVSVAAYSLQKDGLIRYGHGQMTVLDRQGLEAIVCDCYYAIKRAFDCAIHPNLGLEAVSPSLHPSLRSKPKTTRLCNDGRMHG